MAALMSSRKELSARVPTTGLRYQTGGPVLDPRETGANRDRRLESALRGVPNPLRVLPLADTVGAGDQSRGSAQARNRPERRLGRGESLNPPPRTPGAPRPRPAQSGPGEHPYQDIAPGGIAARAVPSEFRGTPEYAPYTPRGGAYSPTGMLRTRQTPDTTMRTQLIGGSPGAVRYTSPRHGPSELGVPYDPGYAGLNLSAAPPTDEATATAQARDDRIYEYAQGLGRQYLGMAHGGQTPPGPTDTTPAWLTPGEFVVDQPHAREIRAAQGPELRRALAQLAEDIKSGRPPGLRSVGGRGNFAGGGTVRDDNQPGYEHGGVHLTGGSGTIRDTPNVYERLGSSIGDAWDSAVDYWSDDAPAPPTGPSEFAIESGRRQEQAKKDEATARSRREGEWSSMSAANERRKNLAISRGGKLKREMGQFARQEHQINTAQAARAALAGSAIQPVEANLSRASQMQLRSALQGALIQSAANIEAERMSFQAEADAVNGELAIIASKINAETNDVARAQFESDREDALRTQEYFQDKAMDAQLRLQKASDPGWLKTLVPLLIQGGFTLLGAAIAGPGGAVGGNVLSRLLLDRMYSGGSGPVSSGISSGFGGPPPQEYSDEWTPAEMAQKITIS